MGYTLITGASSGIGKAFADVVGARRRNLILTARRTDAMEAHADVLRRAHGIDVVVIPADLADPAAPEALWSQATAGRRVDFLINNAGLGVHGAFTDTDWDRERAMLTVNIFALTALAKRAGQDMRAAGGGRILNVASVAAFIPGPNMAAYCATKAYVLSLSAALNEELAGTGVSVTALCPGATESEFFASAKMGHVGFTKARLPSAAAVARFGYFAALDRRPVATPGWMNRMTGVMARALPRPALARIAGRALG